MSLQDKLAEMLGNPQFADVEPQRRFGRFEVALFDPEGVSQGFQEFDSEEAAENYARHITARYPELFAHQGSSGSDLIYVFRRGCFEGVIMDGAQA